jgi:hypothetical protein
VTHLIPAGTVVFWSFVKTGHIQRLETMMVPIVGIAHFILIIACPTAFFNQPQGNKKWLKFADGVVLTIAYMA